MPKERSTQNTTQILPAQFQERIDTHICSPIKWRQIWKVLLATRLSIRLYKGQRATGGRDTRYVQNYFAPSYQYILIHVAIFRHNVRILISHTWYNKKSVDSNRSTKNTHILLQAFLVWYWSLLFEISGASLSAGLRQKYGKSSGPNTVYLIILFWRNEHLPKILCFLTETESPINLTPRPYLRVLWIRTPLYPESGGRR